MYAIQSASENHNVHMEIKKLPEVHFFTFVAPGHPDFFRPGTREISSRSAILSRLDGVVVCNLIMHTKALYNKQFAMKRNLLHSTVYCSAFSPYGKYLAVGTNFGEIAIFDIAAILSNVVEEKSENSRKPINTFSGHDGPVYNLASTDLLLISGGLTGVNVWKWTDITQPNCTVKKQEAFSIDCCITSLCYGDKSNQLFVGGEDSIVSKWDMQSGSLCGKFEGHQEYIHNIALLSNSLATASEDGTVKIWDCQTFNEVKTIEPSKNKSIRRPKLGSWIKCLAVDDTQEWLVCGGGPMTSLWHIRSTSLVHPAMDTPKESIDFIPHSLHFFEDEIIGSGNQPFIHRWRLNGSHKASIPCKLRNIFSIAFSRGQTKKLPLAITGTGSEIQLFTNIGYDGPCLSLV